MKTSCPVLGGGEDGGDDLPALPVLLRAAHQARPAHPDGPDGTGEVHPAVPHCLVPALAGRAVHAGPAAPVQTDHHGGGVWGLLGVPPPLGRRHHLLDDGGGAAVL